jgi:excisionase family DNA binding protein
MWYQVCYACRVKVEPSTSLEPLLSPLDVAAALGVCRRTVYSMIRSGRLVAIDVGLGAQLPRYRIAPSEVRRFQRSGRAQ